MIANYLAALRRRRRGRHRRGARAHRVPGGLQPAARKTQDLRYGENPHQSAAFYRDAEPARRPARRLARSCRARSCRYNNIADADAAWECVKTFGRRAGLRHRQARQPLRRGDRRDRRPTPTPRRCKTDPTSAFGGIIAFNRPLDAAAAELVAQAVRRGADRARLHAPRRARCSPAKQNVRLLEVPLARRDQRAATSSASAAACCVQTADAENVARAELRVVTQGGADAEQQMDDLLFAWKVAKFVKSNAIVFCAGGMTLGVGAGQMSRIDSARIAAHQGAATPGCRWQCSAVASDAFFPFRDGLDVVVRRGRRLRHPARRLDARRRGHRRRRRARHRDGLHRHAPLPALAMPLAARAMGLLVAFIARLVTGDARALEGLPAEGGAAHLLRQPPEPPRLGADLGRAAERPARRHAADRGARLLDRRALQALDHARGVQRGVRGAAAHRRPGPARAAGRGAGATATRW